MDMYSDKRGEGAGGVHVHPVHPGWIRPCFVYMNCYEIRSGYFLSNALDFNCPQLQALNNINCM